MNRCRSALVVAFLLAGLAVSAADIWTDLGSQEPEARAQAVQSVLNGSVPSLGAQVFKKAPTAMRVALVQRALAAVKALTQSPAFKAAYDTARASERPEAPTATASYADQLKAQRADFEKSVVEMRKNAAGQSKEVRDMIETTIAQMRSSLDKMAKDPEQMKMMEGAVAQGRAADEARYKQDLAKFDEQHPVAVRSALARQLHRFLETCGTVDFNAKLVPASGVMRFANPDYERKPSEWKMCFRAGREPVDAAKAVAAAWLKEIGG